MIRFALKYTILSAYDLLFKHLTCHPSYSKTSILPSMLSECVMEEAISLLKGWICFAELLRTVRRSSAPESFLNRSLMKNVNDQKSPLPCTPTVLTSCVLI